MRKSSMWARQIIWVTVAMAICTGTVSLGVGFYQSHELVIRKPKPMLTKVVPGKNLCEVASDCYSFLINNLHTFDGREKPIKIVAQDYSGFYVPSSSQKELAKRPWWQQAFVWILVGIGWMVLSWLWVILKAVLGFGVDKTKSAIMDPIKVARETRRVQQTGTQAERDETKREIYKLRRELEQTRKALEHGSAPANELPDNDGIQAGDTKTLVLPGGAELVLVWCPPGSFTMGSSKETIFRDADETPHPVTLTHGFWIGKYPITQRQWKSVMQKNPSRFKSDSFPVEKVSWDACQAFCRKAGMGLRLPTEAEWEYACRAGTTTEYFWGDKIDQSRANYSAVSNEGKNKKMTMPVGSYKGNPWGIYDMHGNVKEWCFDWLGDYPHGAVVDPKGPPSGKQRILRGGSWNSYDPYCRSASRGAGLPFDDVWFLTDGSDEKGFRVCQSE